MAPVLISLILLSLLVRGVWFCASLTPRRDPVADGELPTVQILVAARDEERALPGLLEALDGLSYDPDRLHVVLVSDGSKDATLGLMQAWCAARRRATVVGLPEPGGKAAALAEAWRAAPGAELTAIYDADVRPAPDALRLLACEFGEPLTGAASGSVWPSNADDNGVTRYAALELFTFHLVIQAARDRLGLDPIAVGAHCVYRTRALADVGGLNRGHAVGEDVQTSFALVRAGWRTRFQGKARVSTRVPTTVSHFWKQRQRWARNSSHALAGAPGPGAVLTATGYMDRLVFLATVLAAQAGVVAWWWPLAFFAGPALNVAAALRKARVASPIRFLLAAVPMFAVDVVVSLAGSMQGLLPSGRWASGVWDKPE